MLRTGSILSNFGILCRPRLANLTTRPLDRGDSMTSTVTTPVLALTPEDRARAGELLLTLLDDYERGLPTAPLVPELDDKALTDLLSTPISREGLGVEGVF